MALHQRDTGGRGKEKEAELYADDAEPGAPSHATGRVPPWREQLTLRGQATKLNYQHQYRELG
jgi:hypothetical protein